jgi:MFS family permease
MYCINRNLVFWLPVFFLYFSSLLSVSEVLLLEAIYYASVVTLEVPSGYLSDRVGRRLTLIAAMLCWVVACGLFAATQSFAFFAAAQVLMAAGMAFNSGTDSSMLYDSLDALDRSDEFARRESRAQALGSAAMAVAALVGGALSGFDLRIAYVLSSLGALGAMLCAASFAEPLAPHDEPKTPSRPESLRTLSTHPVLRWMFAFTVGMTVINHVPYELFQPWVDLFLGSSEGLYSSTPAATGALVAVMMAASALASTVAVPLQERFGTSPVLLASTLIQAAVIASLTVPPHMTVVALLALRSVPQGLSGPVAAAAIHPHLPSSVRATWLSIQSLGGRLAFALTLMTASFWTAQASMSAALISSLAAVATVGALLLAAGLMAFRPAGLDAPRETRPPPHS